MLASQLAAQMYTIRDYTKNRRGFWRNLCKNSALSAMRRFQLSAIAAMDSETPEVSAAQARQNARRQRPALCRHASELGKPVEPCGRRNRVSPDARLRLYRHRQPARTLPGTGRGGLSAVCTGRHSGHRAIESSGHPVGLPQPRIRVYARGNGAANLL